MNFEEKRVSVTEDEIENISRAVEKALSVVYCAMDYACPPDDRHAPYLEPASSAAIDILTNLKCSIDKLTEQA